MKSKPTIAEMRAHVLELCERHEFIVNWCRRSSQAQALRMADEITIAPIRSTLSYATALHELGHLLGRHQDSRRVMVRERWAWRWARQNALIWTPTIERQMRDDLAWYAARAAKIDRDWRPPEVYRE
jgi:hypothetical protein